MLISAIPQFRYYSNITVKEQNQSNSTPIDISHKLSQDTVTFSGKIPNYKNSFFMEALGRGYDSAESGLITKAKEFHKSLKKAVEKVKEFGFSYDEAYNSKCPIKKKASVLDKYERQGAAQDLIRGTVYWQDQHDITAFKKFLDAMKEEGWEIAPFRKADNATNEFIRNKKGSIIKYPDLEIRQYGITQESLAPLGEFIQRADISKPRASTYSDWQIRFIKSNEKGKKEDRQSCEVIILYGPHYKDAKEIEHKYVYEPVRKLKKLHVDRNPEHHPKDSAGRTISENLKEIEKRLIQFISQPLFTNAYNADLKTKEAEIPVEISDAYANLITNYAKGIKKSIPQYYKQMSKELLTEEKIKESIKATPSYNFRSDKTISPQEIKEQKREIREKLLFWEEQDSDRIDEVLKDLNETICKFGIKS